MPIELFGHPVAWFADMIDSKQALVHAIQSLVELMGTRELLSADGIQLEEIELDDDGKYWNVTLSYPVKISQPEEAVTALPTAWEKLVRDSPRRKWRTLKIDSQDGRLVAMKVPATVQAI